MELDAVLIEQSIAKQYGVLPAAQGDLPYQDWEKLVSGLMDDTPLGRVVYARSETDQNALKGFTPWQKQIRADWARFKASKVTGEQNERSITALQNALKSMFGKR